jgi:hypothetical protein
MSDVQYLNVMYDFIDDGKGDLMIVMDAPEGTADDENAKIVYDDGAKQATLIRNSNQVIRMPFLVEKVRAMLTDGREKILVTEMNGEEIADVYEARLEILNGQLPIANNMETEHFYDVLLNAEGDILFCVRTRDGEPKKPKIVYSGEEHALFYRRPDQMIVLDYVHPDVRAALGKVSEVLIAEFLPGDNLDAKPDYAQQGIVREYTAELSHVSKLPVDLTGI